MGQRPARSSRRADGRGHLAAAGHGLCADRRRRSEFGLYSAFIVTAVASVLGSSSHLINGPTSAISLLIFSALAGFDPDARLDAYEALFLLGIMAGAIQIGIAVFKLGDLTRYISESVILGFMTGASFLLAIGQIGNALGIRDKGTGHQHVLHRLWLTLTQSDAVNMKALFISAATVVLALVLRKLVRRYRLPQMDMLTVLIVMSLVAFFAGWSVPDLNGKTAIAVAGIVPASLPVPHIPEIKFSWIADMWSGALAIAFLGLIEALAIAKSIANQTRQPLDYNRQCLAEGVANLTGGFFQCMPGSGSLSRSAINFQAGAATRFSGIITALAVAAAVLVFASFTRFIPKPALAGLLLVTAARLIDLKRLRYTLRASNYDAGLVVVTAATGVFIDIEYSVLIGVALSILLFVPRAAKLKASELVVSEERVVRERLTSDPPCSAFILYDLEGELFFGAAPELDRYLTAIKQKADAQNTRIIILRVKRVRNPDVVCLERIEHFLHEAEAHGTIVLLAGVRPEFRVAISKLGFDAWFPSDQIFLEEDDRDSATLKAVRRAYEWLGDANSCPHCAPAEDVPRAKEKLYYLV